MDENTLPGMLKYLASLRRYRLMGLVILLYGLITLLMTWPVITRLDSHLIGRGSDAWSHYWNFWWVKQAFLNGQSPYYSSLLYYADGVSLTTQNIAWVNSVMWLPLQALVGGVAAYNLAFMAIFVLNATAVYLFLRDLAPDYGFSRPVAFVSGLLYSFWPFIQRHSIHPNLILTAAIPIALIYLRRTVQTEQKCAPWLAGLFVGLTGITRWQLLLMAFFIFAPYLLYLLWSIEKLRWRTLLGRLLLTGGVAAIIMFPLAWPVAIEQIRRDNPEDIYLEDPSGGQTDLLAYLIPLYSHPVWGRWVDPIYDQITDDQRNTPFIGYVALLLVLWGLWQQPRKGRFWLVQLLLLLVLALGTTLHVYNHTFPALPMPYRYLEKISLFALLRRPERFNVLVGLPTAVLAAIGLVSLLQTRWGKRPLVLIGLIAGAILFEYNHYPFINVPIDTPGWFVRELAQEPGNFGIVDLPIDPRGADKRYMFYQTIHQKPLISGHVSRLPREAFNFINSVSMFSELIASRQIDASLPNITQQLRLLAAKNFRYLILHKDPADPLDWQGVERWLGIEPYYEDNEIAVYGTSPQFGQDFTWQVPLTAEMGLIDITYTMPAVPQAGLVEVTALWGSSQPPVAAYDVCLNVVNTAGNREQMFCQPLSPDWPTNQWLAHEVVRQHYTFFLSPFLPEGRYSLQLSLAVAEGSSSSRLLVGMPHLLGEVVITPQERLFALPKDPFDRLEVAWENGVRLVGFNKQVLNGPLSQPLANLTLFWQATRRIDRSDTVFVHLLANNGRLVTQNDAIPRQGLYPMTWWEAQEYVVDTVSLDLTAVPPGTYTLKIGLYNPDTGERVPTNYPDNAVPLTTVQKVGE